MINPGSHSVSDDKLTREMASALPDYHGRNGAEKAEADGDIQTVINKIIGKEIKEGILAGLEAESVSTLQYPNVGCTVHHGEANSFYEGVWLARRTLSLSSRYDMYDANRAEFLNVRPFGNKAFVPSVRADEFGEALVRVTTDIEAAVKFRTLAKHLKELCR
ncbi:hypothetical protein J3R83DRAFT_10538 [Lanmaoa asiatica]|nr:hypothetical protein J3R83DRAFT_10538 [Lanmaoa asiatica]